MDDGGVSRSVEIELPNKFFPEDVFRERRRRRAGIISALTNDVEKFYEQCDPGKENLCLYGHPDGTWEVAMPVEQVPPELPEPVIGINFARDAMGQQGWLSMVAQHSDAWLMSLAFFLGVRFGFDKEARRRLFMLINDLPTVWEVVSGSGKNQSVTHKGNSKNKNNSGSKAAKQSKSNSKPPKQPKQAPAKLKEHTVVGEDKDEALTLCGVCQEAYTELTEGEFWIFCDACGKWFHGKCVQITPAKAQHIKQYKCPSCKCKRRRE